MGAGKKSTTSTAYECRHCKTPLKGRPERSTTQGWAATNGSPFPFGLKWHAAEQTYNFALYSKHAERVELLFFKADDLTQPSFVFQFAPLKNKSGRIWHCRIPVEDVKDASYYAYRVDGPRGGPGFDQHEFDPDKLLIDPYARSIHFPPDFDRHAARNPGSNMGRAPLALLDECQCPAQWHSERHVRRDEELIIYEMHVRGFTRHPSSGVSEDAVGTFQGVVEKIPYLLELGVTAVELMPIFQFDPQEGSYWGYMPLNFFAPHHGYSESKDSCGQRKDFQKMVEALHRAGLELILDVVFNHTTEGDEHGPRYSFKGIDNSTYYVTTGDSRRPYANFSGCGNTVHTANAATRRLVIDSLRYWAGEMHVDGFRFDLASAFTRNSDGSINVEDPPLFAEIAGDPILEGVRMIAEPWDAAGNVLLGSRFPGTLWSQWNANYRDTLQRFIRGDAGQLPDLMTRLYGSSDLFPDDAPIAMKPFQSVNYISSHDGSTLYDLVAYSKKRNQANGHNNTDGPTEFSFNCGHEGDEDVPGQVMALRKRQVRNFFCLLMLSNGTPMFRMGDEFLQTQRGNSNPYNQDNETSWLDWNRLGENKDVFRFFQEMIAFRKAHRSLSRFGFWREDVSWFGPDGDVDLSSQHLAFQLEAESTNEHALYVMINGSGQATEFTARPHTSRCWTPLIDTSKQNAFSCSLDGDDAKHADRWIVEPHSILVLGSS